LEVEHGVLLLLLGAAIAPMKGGDLAQAEITRSKPNVKNRAAPEVEAAVVALAIEQPGPDSASERV
jgi:hypothetical protein